MYPQSDTRAPRDLKLLLSRQFSYSKKRNTLATTLLLYKLREKMNKREITGSIFIDLSKAFDMLLFTPKLPTIYQVVESRELSSSLIIFCLTMKQTFALRSNPLPVETLEDLNLNPPPMLSCQYYYYLYILYVV